MLMIFRKSLGRSKCGTRFLRRDNIYYIKMKTGDAELHFPQLISVDLILY